MRMTIEILNVNQMGEVTVCGRTKIGSIKGFWRAKELPFLNEEYYVEVSLPMLRGSEVCIDKESLSPLAKVSSDETWYLRGTCEKIEEDDIYIVRYDANWIEMLEITDAKISVGDVISCKVNVNQVELFPIGY